MESVKAIKIAIAQTVTLCLYSHSCEGHAAQAISMVSWASISCNYTMHILIIAQTHTVCTTCMLMVKIHTLERLYTTRTVTQYV